MIKNYLKIAVRTLLGNPTYTFINLLGLASGMTIFLLVMLWVSDEYSYDTSFKDYKKIAIVLSTQTWNEETNTYPDAAAPLADELRKNYSEDFKAVVLISETLEFNINYGDKKIANPGFWAESAFPEFFSLKMIYGSASAFKDPSHTVISHDLALSLFGNTDPIGKLVLINNKFSMKIGGVYENFAKNTRFSGLQILLPWQHNENAGFNETQWSNHHFQVFVKLKNTNVENASARIKNATKSFIKTKSNEELSLQTLNTARLYDKFENGKAIGGRIEYIRLFTVIGIFVLLLACVNFMNLSTARSEKRAKEIGIRKAIGSLRAQLIIQFLVESLLLTFFSFVLSLLFTLIVIPFFSLLTEKQIIFPWSNLLFWILGLAFVFAVGLVSGSYPAFYLSSFNPIRILKNGHHSGDSNSLFRKVLVVGQFTISIGLIIGAIAIFKQINYAQNRPSGYAKNNLLSIGINAEEITKHFEVLRGDLLQTGFVDNVAESSSPVTNVRNHMVSFDWKGRNPKSAPLVGLLSVTHDFGKTVNWQIKEGRDFNRDFPSDSTDDGAFIINEAAARLTGFKNPVGEKIKLGDKEHLVLGVVKDMIMDSPYSSSYPTVFWLNYDWRINFITLRVNKDRSMKQAIASIDDVLKKYSPASTFAYEFVDKQYANKFFDEQQLGKLVLTFTILAVFISCLGLFGLASFVTEQRTKEIGVRKVLGASIPDIWKIFALQFSSFVLLSFLLASPLAWLVINSWLEKYEYRTSLSPWIMIAAGLGTLLITLLTVSFQVIKAARRNPVKALKTD